MRRIALFVMIGQIFLVAAFAFGLKSRLMPLGVPGEWEWQRLRIGTEPGSLVLGLAGVLLFAAFAAAGARALSRPSSSRREATWLAGLAVASVLVQGVVQEASPMGYGLSKWIIALHSPGSSGYYTVAKQQMADPSRFLANYPDWITRQDALHVGTHPPGLFVVAKAMLSLMEANPGLSRWVLAVAPSSVANAASAFRESQGLPRADAAGLAFTGALTLLACALTVVPLYLLGRAVLPANAAWASACFWPLVPSALLFQPTADTAFPFLSNTALALAVWASRVGGKVGWTLAGLSGLTMAVGMFFTLAFLPVGLVVALVLIGSRVSSWPIKAGWVMATGIGFVLGTLGWWWATSANPLAIWWVNQQNHGRFYVQYPRSYVAWLVENPLELAVAIGLSTMLWIVAGLARWKDSPRVSWATLLVLAFLTISGKNLSEVARLWLPLMPPLLVAAGWGWASLGATARTLAGSIILVGLEVLILEATIQVVYPF